MRKKSRISWHVICDGWPASGDQRQWTATVLSYFSGADPLTEHTSWQSSTRTSNTQSHDLSHTYHCFFLWIWNRIRQASLPQYQRARVCLENASRVCFSHMLTWLIMASRLWQSLYSTQFWYGHLNTMCLLWLLNHMYRCWERCQLFLKVSCESCIPFLYRRFSWCGTPRTEWQSRQWITSWFTLGVVTTTALWWVNDHRVITAKHPSFSGIHNGTRGSDNSLCVVKTETWKTATRDRLLLWVLRHFTPVTGCWHSITC